MHRDGLPALPIFTGHLKEQHLTVHPQLQDFLLRKAKYHINCTAYIYDLKGWGEADSIVGIGGLSFTGFQGCQSGVGAKPVGLTQVCWVACHRCLISFFPGSNLNL